MPISKKKPPAGAVEGMDRIIQQIYDDINDVINSINQFALTAEEYQGKPGDIRIVKTQTTGAGFTSTYEIQFKTVDGWIKIEGTPVV